MANSWAGNSYHADTASVSIDIPNVRLLGIIARINGGDGRITLADNNSGRSYPVILDYDVPTANLMHHLDLSDSPILFPNGIRIITLTHASVTLILDRNAQ